MTKPKHRPYKPRNRIALNTWVDRELMAACRAIADYAGLKVSTVVDDALRLWLLKEREGGAAARARRAELEAQVPVRSDKRSTKAA